MFIEMKTNQLFLCENSWILALERKLKIQYWFQQHHGAILSV